MVCMCGIFIRGGSPSTSVDVATGPLVTTAVSVCCVGACEASEVLVQCDGFHAYLVLAACHAMTSRGRGDQEMQGCTGARAVLPIISYHGASWTPLR